MAVKSKEKMWLYMEVAFFFSHQAPTSINYGIFLFSQAPTGEVAEDDGEHGNYFHMY